MSGSALSRWNPWRGLGDLPQGSWVLFFATLVNRAGSMVLPFLVLYLTTRMGFTAARAGFVLAVYGLSAIVAAPVGGRLADRLGAVRLMKSSLVASAAAMALFPFAAGYPAILAMTVLLAVTVETYRPATLVVLTELVAPEQRKAAFALNRMAINLGMSVGPAVGGVLVALSFRSLFWVDAATSVLAAFVLVVRPIRLPAARAHPDGPAGDGGPRSSRPARRNVPFLAFLIAAVPVIVVFFQATGAMSLYVVRDLGYSPAFFGLLFTLNTTLIILLEVRLNFVTSHWPHARTLALGALLVGLGFGALAFCRGRAALAAAVAVWTFGEMLLLPGMSAHVADLAPADRRGEYMGFYSMAWGTGFSVGPWIGTAALDAFGARFLWPACLAASLVSTAAFLRVRKPDAAAT